jgi:hypothetical protein
MSFIHDQKQISLDFLDNIPLDQVQDRFNKEADKIKKECPSACDFTISHGIECYPEGTSHSIAIDFRREKNQDELELEKYEHEQQRKIKAKKEKKELQLYKELKKKYGTKNA